MSTHDLKTAWMFERKPTLTKLARLALVPVALMFAAVSMNATYASEVGRRNSDAALSALPPLAADISQTSVSGISSGAYMAGQFQLAHGDIVVGAAIIAGGPWGCAQSAFSPFVIGIWGTALNFNRAASGCMLNLMQAFGVPSVRVLASRAERLAKRGEIGPLSDVTGDRVFLFAGTRDVIVSPSIVRAARRFYRRIGVPDAQIVFVDQIKAGHGFVTESEGGICAQSATPYVVDCDYDLAGTLLAHIYGPLAARGKREAGRFIAFDQRHYAGRAQNTGLANEGRAYVPDACATTPGCRIHVAFHGCQQNRSAVGDIFIARSGLAEWAASNRMIVLFPQTKATPGNPQGCWDWWGLTGSNYLTRSAPQIATVRAMLAALARAPAK